MVDELIASIVPSVRAALAVLVGHARAQSLHDGSAREVLRGNELQSTDLAGLFIADKAGNLWVDVLELSIIDWDLEAWRWMAL